MTAIVTILNATIAGQNSDFHINWSTHHTYSIAVSERRSETLDASDPNNRPSVEPFPDDSMRKADTRIALSTEQAEAKAAFESIKTDITTNSQDLDQFRIDLDKIKQDKDLLDEKKV